MVGLDEGGTGDDHREPRGQVAIAGHCHAPCRKGIPVVGECSLMHPTHCQELRPQVRITVVGTPPECGARQWRDLAHAPHLSAEVMGFEIDSDSMRLEHRVQRIGDLLPDALLYGKALGKQAHEPGELGNTNDVLMRDVAQVGMPVKRERMMLTERKKVDGSLNNLAQTTVRSTTTFGLERREQFGVALIAFGRIKQGTDIALWRLARGRGVQV